MNKKYNLKLDLQFRCNNSTMKFNQFDNNTSDFFVKISSGGKSFDVEKAIVVLATIKPSGKVASQFVEVENGLVYADLKPSMKDEIGTYTAQAMLILEDERIVTDAISYEVEENKIFALLNDTATSTEEFILLTDMLSRLSTIEISEEQRMINESERILAEENRKIEEAKRVEAELNRQHEEADRSKYEATRESNENIRKLNEVTRQTNEEIRIQNEANRIDAEDKRIKAEQLRKDNYNFMTEDEERRRSEANAHKEAENLRVQAETNRVNEEAKRRTTEQARVSAENTRVNNENTREASEVTRKNNETQRIEAETQRQNRYNSFIADAEANANNFENYTNTAKVKEEERKANELDRKSQEDRRVSNEVERISNENTRKANEVARESNEATRQNTFSNKVSEIDKKIVEINATKDNLISSVTTKVDNKVSEIDKSKSDMTNTVTNKIDEVENRFNALTSKQQQDAEVVDARDGETSLKARLDRDIEKAKQVYVGVEGNYVSTDSSSGYAKDVEILGNTVQDASNLADIRSVGDKVEGQELYEIDVVSCGKNVWNVPISLFNNGKYIQTSGYSKKPGINLPQNSSWTLTFEKKPNDAKLFIWKGDVLSRTIGFGNTSLSQIFTLVDNEDGISFYAGNFGSSPYDIMTVDFKIQLEEGTVATPYEPYQEYKLTILSPVQLEKVGDVADRIIEKDGICGVEKNIETYKFDKTPSAYGFIYNLNWTQGNTCGFYTYYFRDNYPTIKQGNGYAICDKLPRSNKNINTIDEVCVGTNSQYIGFRVPFSEMTSLDKAGAEEWIAKNTPTVKYVLATPQFIPLPHDQQVKLRTFANKTNVSFLTEIEGTIKAQVPKSLGATVNTHTEQISNLNKELDRVKKLEESTVSTVETESDFTTVEATSNGYFEDVKLEGKTLVNLCEKTSHTVIGQDANNWSKHIVLTQPLVIGNKYTLIANVKTYTLDKGYSIFGRDSCSDAQYGLLQITEEGIHKSVFIAQKGITSLSIADENNSTSGESLIEGFILLEGDHTQNPPSFFEGLKSVGDGTDEIVVSSVKGDGNLIKSRLVFNDNEQVEGFSSVYRQFKIPVIKGRIYYLKAKVQTNSNWKDSLCRLYHQSKPGTHTVIYVSTYNNNNDLVDIDISFVANDDYVVFEYYNNPALDKNKNIYDNFDYLCLTSNPNLNPNTDLESDKKRLLYYNEETQTWEKPILREWDSIEKHTNGKYYYHQRSGEVVLNGSENWIIDNNNTRFGLYNIDAITGNVNVNVEQISDKFSVYDRYGEKIGSFGVGTGFVRIQNNFGFTTANEFKTWLQTNNLTVVYQLAEEKVNECTNIDLITYEGETNYIVECGAIVPRTTLKVHNNISNVVSLLQKKVSLLESNMTSYIITQNRLMLTSRYNADTVGFKVDVASYNNSFEYDNDLYELILNNILVGKDNYDRDYIENLIIFYWMDFVISDEMHSTLFEIIEEQHNPKIVEEAPIE